MKKDVYELPLFLSKDDISGNLKLFLESVQHDQITGFRKMYNTDKNAFFTLINEMVLRGFKFLINSNLFPKVNFDSSEYLVCKNTNSKEFQKINFDVLGIGSIINEFDINDDLFFNKIPLEGFLFFNPQIDRKYLKKLFENAGFEIKNNNIVESEISNDGLFDFDQNYISNYYSETKFNAFRIYCATNSYYTMEDLNLNIINSLKNEKGFGEKKVKKILERYQSWLTKGEENNIKSSQIMKIDFTKYNFKIEVVFNESKYRKFLQFCASRNIKLISDLNDKTLLEFSKQRSVGKKKVDEVWQMLLELTRNYSGARDDVFTINIFDKLILLDLSVNEYFEIFNIDSETSIDLYLSDLQNKKYTDLLKYCSFDSLNLLEKYLNGFQNMQTIFKNVVNGFLESKSESYRVVTRERIENNKTLEEVAEILGITRERVRQIAKTILKKINCELYKESFFSYLKLFFWDKQIIIQEDFIKIFPKHYAILIALIKEGNTNIFWNSKFNFYSFSEIDLYDPPILTEQKEYYWSKDVINDCLAFWGEAIEDLDEKKVRGIIRDVYGYYDCGEILSRYRLSKTKCIEILLKYYLIDGVRFDNNGCNIIKQMSFEKFGINMYADSNRTIESKARNNENLILIGPKEFKYFQETPNILNLLEEIETYLDNFFDSQDKIESKKLFKVYKDKSISNGILNDFTLYSLVKKYFGDKYTFSKGNEMCIYKSLEVRISKEEQLKALYGSKYFMTKQEITEHLLWPYSKLENTIGNSKSFFCGSLSKVYYYDNIVLNETEVNLLNQYYNQCQESDYCHLNKLFYNLRFDPIFNKIMKKYNIKNGTDLGVLMKYVNGVRPWYNIAFSNESEKKNLVEVLVSRFPGVVYRNEIVEYLKENNYDTRQISFVFSSIDEKNAFINIDRECFVNSKSFSIDALAIKRLLDYVGDQEYILLNSLRGYRKQLPKINYKWTPILMAEVLSRNGYKMITKINKDYRYDYSIVVKQDSKIESLADLFYKILIEEYDGSHNVQSVVSYMNERKVFCNKVLPLEILRDARFNVDEFNVLHWRD